MENNRRKWLCRCDCGNTKVIRLDALQAGMTLSCGCLHKERVSTHGLTGTREYRIWSRMKRSCNVKGDKDYPSYGGRGIKICERWKSFKNFLADMGPSNGLQIERKNNNKGYSPSNCVWATVTQQARNRRSNLVITYKGITACLAEHCERLGLEYYKTHQRIYKGWPLERAFKEK